MVVLMVSWCTGVEMDMAGWRWTAQGQEKEEKVVVDVVDQCDVVPM